MSNFEEKLDENLKILQDCQNSHDLKSCFNCDEIFDCKIRNDYVDSAYDSMSKGESGDFEF